MCVKGIHHAERPGVVLITNVEKFAGHGTTRVALAEGATVLAHDPSFEAPSARRKYEAQFPGAHALSAADATLVELALKRHGHIDALVNNDAYPALRAPLGEARLEDYRAALEAMAVAPFRLTQLVAPVDAQAQVGPHRVRVVGRAAARHRQLRTLVSARAAANGLVSSLAKELGRDGITVNAVGSNYVENPDYFPPALLANQDAMAKMTAQISAGQARQVRGAGRDGVLPLFRCARASSPVTSCRTPAAGRDAQIRVHATMRAE